MHSVHIGTYLPMFLGNYDQHSLECRRNFQHYKYGQLTLHMKLYIQKTLKVKNIVFIHDHLQNN